MKNLTIKITISHNEVNENYSIMCLPSIMTVELDENKTRVWEEVKDFNPNLLNIWANQIWTISHPNIFGKVQKVEILSA